MAHPLETKSRYVLAFRHPYRLPAARKRYSVSPGATLDSFSKIAARSASLLAAA